MPDPVLSVSHVTKRFTGTIALSDVCLNLYDGEILALLGENGAGKSTLMKILSGLYPFSEYEGEVCVGGATCRFRGPQDSENTGIVMIYQELNLELDLTVAENILLGRYPKTRFGLIDWAMLYRGAQDALDKMGVAIDIRTTVRSLSPSMQQLVSIARALYRQPRMLILDEPTSVLTEAETARLMDILRALKARGIACIYISHKLDEVFKLCDRMVILRDGKAVSEYFKQDGYDPAKVIEDMIGRKLDVMYPKVNKQIGEELLRVEGFRVPHPFAYGKSIIENVGLTLHRGEILGLAGLVGAGRSELSEAVFGLTPKSAGEVYLEGKRWRFEDPATRFATA